MTEFQTHFESPEDAYFGFFRADKAKNADAWAAVMSYPHVRVAAAGTTYFFDTPEEYAAGADWTSREATGWVGTKGREPVRLHESDDKVHLVGGWTRYNAQDEPILWNRVTYILTRIDGSWGIQARFAAGSYVEPDDETAARVAADAATRQVREYYKALDKKDVETCAGLCRFPMVAVGVGEATLIENGDQLSRMINERTGNINNLDISAAQAGEEGVIVAVTEDYASGKRERSVVVVGRVDDGWRIGGISSMNT